MFAKFMLHVTRVVMKVLFFYRITGRENIPGGSCMICANHSDWFDPILVGDAVGLNPMMRTMAKQELFEKKLANWFFRKLGAFPVRRGENDLSAIRTALKTLSSGQRLLIFPEGTRYDRYHAKSGAGMIALRTGCAVLPIYVCNEKKLFRRTDVIIGEPYVPEKPAGKPDHADYEACSDEILRRIYALHGEGERVTVPVPEKNA